MFSVKGAIGSPLYGCTIPLSSGTDPGVVCSLRNPRIPICANLPLLISAFKPLALLSSLLFLLSLNGSCERFEGESYSEF